MQYDYKMKRKIYRDYKKHWAWWGEKAQRFSGVYAPMTFSSGSYMLTESWCSQYQSFSEVSKI